MNVFVKRLLLLRDVAVNLPVRGTAKPGKSRKPIAWRQAQWFGKASTLSDPKDRAVPHGCNTTACLAGFAGLTPALNDQGMKTDRRKGTVRCDDGNGNPIHFTTFFGITGAESDTLFGGNIEDRSAKARDRLVGKIDMLIVQAIDRS